MRGVKLKLRSRRTCESGSVGSGIVYEKSDPDPWLLYGSCAKKLGINRSTGCCSRYPYQCTYLPTSTYVPITLPKLFIWVTGTYLIWSEESIATIIFVEIDQFDHFLAIFSCFNYFIWVLKVYSTYIFRPSVRARPGHPSEFQSSGNFTPSLLK